MGVGCEYKSQYISSHVRVRNRVVNSTKEISRRTAKSPQTAYIQVCRIWVLHFVSVRNNANITQPMLL